MIETDGYRDQNLIAHGLIHKVQARWHYGREMTHPSFFLLANIFMGWFEDEFVYILTRPIHSYGNVI